jgi:hypothetical protein
MGQVWVACDADDLPVGVVIASVREGRVRRGAGRPARPWPAWARDRLLTRICAWAKAQGFAAVTLSTFHDMPWNGPFYRKHGFRDLEPEEWTAGMRAIREQEARHGLAVEARVFMRRELG